MPLCEYPAESAEGISVVRVLPRPLRRRVQSQEARFLPFKRKKGARRGKKNSPSLRFPARANKSTLSDTTGAVCRGSEMARTPENSRASGTLAGTPYETPSGRSRGRLDGLWCYSCERVQKEDSRSQTTRAEPGMGRLRGTTLNEVA